MQIGPAAEKNALDQLKIRKGDLVGPDYNILIGTTYLRQLHESGSTLITPWSSLLIHLGPSRLQQIISEYSGLDGRQLVEHHTNCTTRAYVRTILNHK